MSAQTEQEMENKLVEDLQGLGYEHVNLSTEKALIVNLKQQIEDINGLHKLSEDEWKQVLHILKGGTVFDSAEKLRDADTITFDDGTESSHIHLLFDEVNKNRYQVTRQVIVDNRKQSKKGKTGKLNRFDVTILVNGLPLVQLELKKSGMEISEAFNQTMRYTKESYWVGQGLFNYIQLFVISNGTNTRYYANGTKGMEFVFKWTDKDNNAINDIEDFTPDFLNPKHLTEMIKNHIVLNQSNKKLMVLRPYQVYAVKEIVNRVKNSDKNGYIWHATGAGKTVTSFQASQVIQKLPDIAKVIFVVDRNDLDSQTRKQFNAFIDKTKYKKVGNITSTQSLVEQLKNYSVKLVVTTIQKLNYAVTKDKYAKDIAYLKDKKVVLIFDECHRSQFGVTHKNIKAFFEKSQMFGFTGTPIFQDNSTSKDGIRYTTEYLFDELLHSYLIINAIDDKNVLPFKMSYYGKYESKVISDEKVTGIDTKEVYDDPKRLKKIAKFIIDHHDTYTKKRTFTSIFCVSSIDVLIKYYDLFETLQVQKQIEDEEAGKLFTPLKIATIFSINNTKDDYDYEPDEIAEETITLDDVNENKRDKLDSYIQQYYQMFDKNYNSNNDVLKNYNEDIAQRIRGKNIKGNKVEKLDILIVVNMFLTGFSAPLLNTMYVDKNLQQHGLIQAFSRTNRVLSKQKPFGNIICFRNLKENTDNALRLFSQSNNISTVYIPEYNELLAEYNTAVAKLYCITPTSKSFDLLMGETAKEAFAKAFREVMRRHNQLSTFIEYDQDNTALGKEEFNNYTSKYVDLKNSLLSPTTKDKVSILDDIDFQLESISSDNVDADYILQLLQHVVDAKTDEQKRRFKAQAEDMLGGEITLHDKKELIQKFIDKNIPKLITGESVADAFANFWDVEKENTYQRLCEEQRLNKDKFEQIIIDYENSDKLPRLEHMDGLAEYPIKLFDRTDEFNRLLNYTHKFIHTFYDGIRV